MSVFKEWADRVNADVQNHKLLPGLAVAYDLTPERATWVLGVRSCVAYADGNAFRIKLNPEPKEALPSTSADRIPDIGLRIFAHLTGYI